MPTAVTMPQLGETVVEGTITKWLKQEGDRIDRDEPLFEISTDKVDTEVPSPVAGTVAKILVPEGETVSVGTELAQIEEGGGQAAASAEGAKESEAAEAEGGAEAEGEAESAEFESGALEELAAGGERVVVEGDAHVGQFFVTASSRFSSRFAMRVQAASSAGSSDASGLLSP